MAIDLTLEGDDDVVDPEHRDDKFEDVGQEVDYLKPIALLISSWTDDSNSKTFREHIGWP